jgi:hypothetical protein
VLLSLAPAPAAAGYLEELITQARAARLAERREWLALGHYQRDRTGSGYTSVIDSEAFFNAKHGKTDPEAELEATLAAFFAPAMLSRKHPQCAFIARYAWLKSALRFVPERLPAQPCRRFHEWFSAIAAEQVTLVFPAAYLNNPSSMFGHTLLRLDRAGQDERSRLLSYAVNYGADTGADSGLMFAIYGLTGVYWGSYSVMPYYQMVQRYSDFENRDIWEYELNLTEPEIRRLIEHLWELRNQHADYFFFDENCSYQLLFLLDVARPKLHLTDQFDLYAIPIETVRAVLQHEGLMKRAVFRPSKRTRIEHGVRRLDRAERRLIAQLAAGEIEANHPTVTELRPQVRAEVLELAAEFTTYGLRSGTQERSEVADRAWKLLAARSQVDVATDLSAVPAPETRPDQGHRSARFGLGIGTRASQRFFSLHLRPAYHDLTDPQGGYIRGAEIEFLDLELRHYEDRGVDLESFTVLGISSLTPRNLLFRPISWHLKAGLERLRVQRGDVIGSLIATVEGGAGQTLAFGEQGMIGLMADAVVGGGSRCSDTCIAGIGPNITMLWPVNNRWSLNFDGRVQLLGTGGIADRFSVHFGQSVTLTRNLAFKLGERWEDDGGGIQTEWSASLNWYF